MRRSLLAIGLTCLLSGMLATTEVRADSDFKVTLIGTGPRPHHVQIVSGRVLWSKPATKNS